LIFDLWFLIFENFLKQHFHSDVRNLQIKDDNLGFSNQRSKIKDQKPKIKNQRSKTKDRTKNAASGFHLRPRSFSWFGNCKTFI